MPFDFANFRQLAGELAPASHSEPRRGGRAVPWSPLRRGRTALRFVGPAVLASTAYMDPGNFAVNIAVGSGYGYQLLWVVLAANLIAMLFQALSAKLGIATGKNLAELCRAQYAPPVVWGMWAAAELAAMATDLAEFLGGAIGFALLLQIPLLAGMVLTAAATYAILLLDRWGFRPTEIVLTAFVALIGTCYVAELWIAPVDWTEAAIGAATPHLPDRAALALAAGIVGATIMPHALYLHSGLTQSRIPAESDRRRRLLTRFSNREVVVALSVAGAVNLAIVVLAAAGLRGLAGDEATIGAAYHILGPLLGQAAATLFLVSLIASGISSSVVGTMAGQIVMQGFVGFGIPVWVRRLVTMAPAFAIVALGLDAARALVLSQVVLSLVLPVPLIPLVAFTARRDIMGPLANGGLTRVAAATGAGLVVSLDLGLLAGQVFG